MSTRLPLATSGVENVHVIPSGKIDTVTKSREKAGAEGGPRLEREVITISALSRPLTISGPGAQG